MKFIDSKTEVIRYSKIYIFILHPNQAKAAASIYLFDKSVQLPPFVQC